MPKGFHEKPYPPQDDDPRVAETVAGYMSIGRRVLYPIAMGLAIAVVAFVLAVRL